MKAKKDAIVERLPEGWTEQEEKEFQLFIQHGNERRDDSSFWEKYIGYIDFTNNEIYKREQEQFTTRNIDGKKTNFSMYKEIRKLFKRLLQEKVMLDYDMINKVFDLENRPKLDLANLQEFIVVMTLMGGQDILKAQVAGDKVREKKEQTEHKERCDLMMLLTDSISSAMYSIFG